MSLIQLIVVWLLPSASFQQMKEGLQGIHLEYSKWIKSILLLSSSYAFSMQNSTLFDLLICHQLIFKRRFWCASLCLDFGPATIALTDWKLLGLLVYILLALYLSWETHGWVVILMSKMHSTFQKLLCFILYYFLL